MRVVCRHGHFAFYPKDRKEILRMKSTLKIELVAEDDYFTFPALVGLPRWSQVARPFGNLPAVVTYEGRHAWEVMRENDFVFSLAALVLVPRAAITEIVRLPQTQDCIVAPKPLIQPGSILPTGNVLTGYNGELDLDFQRLYIYSQETLL